MPRKRAIKVLHEENTPAPVVSKQKKLCIDFKPKTIGQSEYLKTIIHNSVTFATGPAGCGKSFLCLGLACQYLLEDRFDTIIVARPTVEAAPKSIGYLPGDVDEKLSPYLLPAVEHMKKFLGKDVYGKYYHDNRIQFKALEFCRGSNFDDSFVICEESQNCSSEQLIMLVTRLCENSKMVINGDFEQTDLKKKSGDFPTDLQFIMNRVESNELKHFGITRLTEADIIRNPLIAGFLRAVR